MYVCCVCVFFFFLYLAPQTIWIFATGVVPEHSVGWDVRSVEKGLDKTEENGSEKQKHSQVLSFKQIEKKMMMGKSVLSDSCDIAQKFLKMRRNAPKIILRHKSNSQFVLLVNDTVHVLVKLQLWNAQLFKLPQRKSKISLSEIFLELSNIRLVQMWVMLPFPLSSALWENSVLSQKKKAPPAYTVFCVWLMVCVLFPVSLFWEHVQKCAVWISGTLWWCQSSTGHLIQDFLLCLVCSFV